jgi:hypothetical protein
MSDIRIGDRVRIHLGAQYGRGEGWYEGTVFKIDPYSGHCNFHWVELDAEAQAILGIKQISVFNPRNIEKIESLS